MRLRELIDSLPPDNRLVKLLRITAKSVFFRKRIIRNSSIIFEGVQDAILKRYLSLGPGPEEVLIRTIASAVSPGTERGYYLDLPNFHQPRPYIPGYSGCGRVEAVGGKVSGFRKGGLAAGIFKHSRRNVISAHAAVPVPDGVTSREAAFVTLGVIALSGIRDARLAGGEKVGVLGQGILGQLLDQLARIGGAGTVTALALGDSKRALAEKSGADDFIALQATDRSRSHPDFDLVIDTTGSLRGFEAALEMVRPGGRVVMLGSIPTYAAESDWARLLVEKKIEARGSCVRNLEAEGLSYREEAARFLNLLAGKKVRMDHLVTDICKPREAPAIYRRLADGERNLVGVLIDWQ